jgi:hypothetical protein
LVFAGMTFRYPHNLIPSLGLMRRDVRG